MQKIWKKETVFSWWQQPSTQHKRHSHPAQPQQPGIRRGIITASFTPQKKLDRQELRRPGKQNTKRSSIVRRPTTGIPHTYPRPRISLLVKTLFREPLLSVSSATRTLPCSHAPVSFRNSFFYSALVIRLLRYRLRNRQGKGLAVRAAGSRGTVAS